MSESLVCKFKYLFINSVPKTDNDSFVYYEGLDGNNKQIFSKNDICFRDLSLHPIPEDIKRVRIHRDRTRIPYSEYSIARWITEINKLGFPCSFSIQDSVYLFTVDLSKFKNKPHFVYTLQLIRVMFERGLCYVPELYFDLIDQNLNIDRFQALQDAHKNIYRIRPSVGANPNHAITSIYNGTNISQTHFFSKLEKADELYTKRSLCYDKLWNGSFIS